MQTDGFIGLLASLGIPLISSLIGSLIEKGCKYIDLEVEEARDYKFVVELQNAGLQIVSTIENV